MCWNNLRKKKVQRFFPKIFFYDLRGHMTTPRELEAMLASSVIFWEFHHGLWWENTNPGVWVYIYIHIFNTILEHILFNILYSLMVCIYHLSKKFIRCGKSQLVLFFGQQHQPETPRTETMFRLYSWLLYCTSVYVYFVPWTIKGYTDIRWIHRPCHHRDSYISSR